MKDFRSVNKARKKAGKTMNRKRNQLIAFALAAIIFVGAGSHTAKADDSRAASVSYDGYATDLSTLEREYLSLHTLQNKNIYAYNRLNVSILGSSLSVKGFLASGAYYVPFRASANAIGASYSYNSATKTATMKIGSLTLVATSGNYVVYANGRPLFSTSPVVIMSDGRMYLTREVLAKALGLTASGSSSITLSGRLNPMGVAPYSDDEVFWLARIIHAESQGEPLLGQIAVGNVVLNRVRSPLYPNTIYGVIFDRNYGVQFSPVLNGTIYNTPSYNSTLAAKICLEGFDLSGGALFFLHPALSTSSWIPKTRYYAFSVGKHDFYN